MTSKSKRANIKPAKLAKAVSVAVPQDALDAIGERYMRAECARRGAILDAFLLCIGGTVDAKAVQTAFQCGEATATIRASRFNAAHKLGAILGADATARIITEAAATGGDVEKVVASALKRARDAATGAAPQGKTPTATQLAKMAKAATDAAKVDAADKAESRKRQPRPPASGTKVTVPQQLRQDVAAMLATLGKFQPSANRTGAYKGALKALQDAAEHLAKLG